MIGPLAFSLLLFCLIGSIVAMAHGFLEVGAIVRHPLRPEWGRGQVQSIIGPRITVNFEHSGKVVLQGDDPGLELVAMDEL